MGRMRGEWTEGQRQVTSKEGEFNRQAQLVTQPLVWYPLGDVPYVPYVFIKMT